MEKKNFAYLLFTIGICLMVVGAGFRYNFFLFGSEGFLGNGTSEKPYLITDLDQDFELENSEGIYIIENETIDSISLRFSNISKIIILNSVFVNSSLDFSKVNLEIHNSQFMFSNISSFDTNANISSCEFSFLSSIYFEDFLNMDNCLFLESNEGINLNEGTGNITNSLFYHVDSAISVSDSLLELRNNTFVRSFPVNFSTSQIVESGRVILDELIEIPHSILSNIKYYELVWQWNERINNFFDISIQNNDVEEDLFHSLNETYYVFNSTGTCSQTLHFQAELKSKISTYSVSFENELRTENSLPILSYEGSSYKKFDEYLSINLKIQDPDILNGSLVIKDENGIIYLNSLIIEDGDYELNVSLPTFVNWTKLFIIFNDGFGGQVQQTIYAIYVNAYSFNCEFLENSIDLSVNITSSTSIDGTYELYRNNTLLLFGEWDESTQVDFPQDFVLEGYNLFDIIVSDRNTGEQCNDSIHVVKDDQGIVKKRNNFNPTISEPFTQHYISLGEALQVIINDDIYSEFTVSLSNVGFHEEQRTSNKSLVFNGLDSGEYFLIVEDGVGGFVEKQFNLTILNEPPVIQYNLINETISFDISDNDYMTQTWAIILTNFQNESTIQQLQEIQIEGEWSNDSIVVNCSQFMRIPGNYTFVLEVSDGDLVSTIIFTLDTSDNTDNKVEDPNSQIETIMLVSGGSLILASSVIGVVVWKKQQQRRLGN